MSIPAFHLLDKRAEQLIQILDGPDNLHLTTEQAAEWLGVSRSWLEQGRSFRRHGPPFKKENGKVLYRLGDVRKWLRSRTIDPAKRRQQTARHTHAAE